MKAFGAEALLERKDHSTFGFAATADWVTRTWGGTLWVGRWLLYVGQERGR